VSDDEDRLVAEIPSELKELVDADQRSNKEIVIAALWREFGGERMGVLDRRIEEKKRRISIIESEKNERKRELETENEELDALLKKKDEMKTQTERKQEEVLEEAAEKLPPSTWLRSAPKESQIPDVDSDAIQDFAKRAEMDPQEFRDRVIARILEAEE